ncbi:unnamed protein product [Ilex paraguariensis]|uniref:BHLH domain-containing protein n=1 Tax=Ilex paraguariensis TaxID=185542 RepID=A0ABC8SDX4_9AQUA
METVVLDEEWDSLSRMFSGEEANFVMQFHGHDLFPNGHGDGLSYGTTTTFWPIDDETNTNIIGVDESLLYSSDTLNTYNVHCFSQEGSNSCDSNGAFFPILNHENQLLSDHSNFIPVTTNSPEAIDFCILDDQTSSLVPVFRDDAMEDILSLKEEFGTDKLGTVQSQPEANSDSGKESELKRKSEMPESQNSKKKPGVSRNAQKNKKNAPSKKSQKLTLSGNNEEETNTGPNGQSCSCYNSEDDSNASQELNEGVNPESKVSLALNLDGKTRASRGSATDPQSLYARKRRERINERLRILQNLVPNGTKVDISTMLEEAVHYVKFLQLQIKLLTSDDLWMYAPIAYNGMDMGLYQMISPTL